ncbi:hypothetical protein BGX34_010616 [Mortierella sp. NVP85]|nr:hypothetical protein BGX34_010616 [Mortierella sp. NVP85]
MTSTKTGLLKSPSHKPTMVARSTSTSALPSPHAGFGVMSAPKGMSVSGTATPTRALSETASLGGATPNRPQLGGSGTASPFLGGMDFHHHHHHPPHTQNTTGPAQLRQATHSPAFLSKFYDAEHRLPSNIPWLALPGAAAPSSGLGAGAESSPTMFGRRRRSDAGLPSSGTSSTPVLSQLDKLSHELPQQQQQQENPHPQPSQAQQHHPHHYHLLSHQELAALSRNNSPMPLNEALPNYLRKKNLEPMHAMERSFSNPASGTVVHSAPVSPFMLPIHPTAYNKGVTHMRYPLGNPSDLDLSTSKELPAKPRA